MRNTLQRLEELTIEEDADETDDAQRGLAIAEVKSRSKLLETDQVCKGVIYAQIRSRITQQSIEDVITSAESSAIVGLPETVVDKIDLRIRKVHTMDHSKAVVGVFPSGFKMEDFF
jgi:alkanesulfonate monooxygenase SsuD/methylene tetrahydromethanopterin reductase-like flavin-dependent oxidoreductase (luciferase family)